MLVLYNLETGQPLLAACTALSNASCVAPGTLAVSSRWLSVMAKPSGCFSRLMVQVVSSDSAVRFACASWAERAIVKQPACAAASNSSGLVPLPSSKRLWKEYGVDERTPLAVERSP